MSTKRTATRAVAIAAPAKSVRPKKKPADDDILVDIRADIIQWHVAAEQSAVEARIAIGGKLVEAKERMDHGAFARWVEEHLPFEIRTAERAMKLYFFAISHPDEVPKLTKLGVSKAYALTQVFSPLRKALLSKSLHELDSPHSDSPNPVAPIVKPLAHMTYLQLRGVIRKAEGKGKPPPSAADALTREVSSSSTSSSIVRSTSWSPKRSKGSSNSAPPRLNTTSRTCWPRSRPTRRTTRASSWRSSGGPTPRQAVAPKTRSRARSSRPPRARRTSRSRVRRRPRSAISSATDG